jgi:hypothetical protein
MIVGGLPLFLNIGPVGPVGPWSFVAAGTVTSWASVSATDVPVPAGILAKDLLILWSGNYSAQPYTPLPSGWTSLYSYNTLGDSIVVLYKVSDGTETVASLTHSSTAGKRAVILAYRGTTLAPFDVSSTAAQSNSTPVTTNSLTTALNNELVISFCYTRQNVTEPSTPASTTSRVSNVGAATYPSFRIVDENKATAGATTGRAFTTAAPSVAMSSAFKQA